MKKENSVKEYNGILIDYSRDRILPEQGLALLTGNGFYRKSHENSPQETFARASTCYSFGDYEFAQRIYEYASKKWFTFASPVLSNAVDVEWPTFGEDKFEEAGDWLEGNVTPEGMSISCFLSMISDDRDSLVETRSETAWMSMMGGGIGIYAGNRAPDSKSTGVMAHLAGYDADTLSFKQAHSRRGSMAAYLDIRHPEIMSFIQMRNPVGGDTNKKCFNLNNAVVVDDKFMQAVLENKPFELVDPKHGPTGTFLNAKEVWDTIMQVRYETGEPYIMFLDTVNRNKPSWITNPLYEVRQSNLCSEIVLMTSRKRSAVCCLSSLNLELFDEWKDTNIVQDLVRLLDNVLEYFIRLAPPQLNRAIYSAQKERAIGLGTLGWGSLLQKNMIPFESEESISLTREVYSHLLDVAKGESKRLGAIRGEPDDVAGSGMRNSHLFAIAPNASSSSIVNASPSIEPWNSNAFVAQGRAGTFLIRNVHLEKLLEEKGMNTPEVWKSITDKEGSVQHLEGLSEKEKAVFKTAFEIDPMWIVKQAAERQKYICQAQSLNIFVDSSMTAQRMGEIHIEGWLRGIKTFYYCRAKPTSRAKVGDGKKAPLNSVQVDKSVEIADPDDCLSCQA